MKFVTDFRRSDLVKGLVAELHRITTRSWKVMEICGGQTHSIYRYGLQQLLPEQINLLHGPGCPVCVTPVEKIDLAVKLSLRPKTILCCFGDMMRVPGSVDSLMAAKSRGGALMVVTSPLEAVDLARKNPELEVVFFSIGFETTIPANAMAVYQAHKEKLRNFSLLVSQVTVPPAIRYLLSQPNNKIHGFLGAGHVCAVMGFRPYHQIADQYATPIVITGFEPVDILLGLTECVRALERGTSIVYNHYQRAVEEQGNRAAQRMMAEVFVPVDQNWRGIGVIAESGLALAPPYELFDAEKRYGSVIIGNMDNRCQAGAVLLGELKPEGCPYFGKVCQPSSPLGAPMVSSEGPCAAAFHYQRPSHHQTGAAYAKR